MSKIKKTDLLNLIQEQADKLVELKKVVGLNKQAIIMLENERENPQPKQLDQCDDLAKELLEVDLSSELTGSELCKAMLARGDKYVMCRVDDDNNIQVINSWSLYGFISATNKYCLYKTPIPINNQGKPLTASDAGI